jgi:hypothetical protein
MEVAEIRMMGPLFAVPQSDAKVLADGVARERCGVHHIHA